MKAAIIGCGNIAECHFTAVGKTEGVEIAAVADIKSDRAKNAAEKLGCRAYTDYTEMLDKEKPDCVHICTPHYLHTDMCIEALKRNINVLCEKPCAISEKELVRIGEAVKESKARFGVCFQNRYNGSVKLAKELLKEKRYGNIVCASAEVKWKREKSYYGDDWHGQKEKEGGGVLINQAIHTLDLLRYLLGEKLEYVTGHAFNEKFAGQIDVEDTVTARFETQSGLTAVFYATVGAGCDHPITIDIVCEKAVLRVEGNNLYVIENVGIKNLYLDDTTEFIGKIYWGKSHEALIADFYDCIKTGRAFPIGFDEGEKAVRELLAVYDSSEKNKRVKIRNGGCRKTGKSVSDKPHFLFFVAKNKKSGI